MPSCAGWRPIDVTAAEIAWLFPTPAVAPAGVDPALWRAMRATYREVAEHNRYWRLRCENQ